MAGTGKIFQNITGIETKMDELKKETTNFMEDKPFLGDIEGSLIKIEKECKGVAYNSIKDNDKEAYEVLKNWCDLSTQLVSFLQADIDVFREANGG